MPVSDETVLDMLAGLTRQFKTEDARLRGHESLASLDFDGLSDRLGQLKATLAKCLSAVAEQQQSGKRAAAAVQEFCDTLAGILKSDTHRIRARQDELNDIKNPDELINRTAVREDEMAEVQKALKIKQTMKQLDQCFEELGTVLDDTKESFEQAKARATIMREELEQAQIRQENQRRADEAAAEKRREEELRRRQAEAEAEAAKAERRRGKAAAVEGGAEEKPLRRKSSSRRRTHEGDEQRRREAEAAAEAAERQWRPVIFRASAGGESEGTGEFDFDCACAIRAPDGAVPIEKFRCHIVPLDEVDTTSIPPTEELVGNVVRFEAVGLSRLPLGREHRHWYFMLPHCAQRQTFRETVIYMLKDDKWAECQSNEVHVEGLEFQTRWVETRITEANVMAVAVNKLKTDRISVGKSGIRFSSSVDNRISLSVPEDALKIQLDQSLEVQPVDSSTLAAIKSQHPRDTQGLLTSSSIIQHTSICKNMLRQATFSFPLPLNPSGSKKPRPGTASDSHGIKQQGSANNAGLSARPMTAAPERSHSAADDDDDDELVVVVGCNDSRGHGGTWSVLDNLEIEEETGKDTVSFRVARFFTRRFIAFRVRPEFNMESAGRMCEAIEKSLEAKTACFVLRQKSENLTEVTLALSATSRLDRTLKQLQDGGYDYDIGSGSVSDEIHVRERQQFRLRFRGNVICEGDDQDEPSVFVVAFNSQMKNRLHFAVTEKDRFAQRALDQYRGYLEIATDVTVQRPVKDSKKGTQMVTVTEEMVVAKMLISIPKSDEDLRVKSPRASPFVFKSKDAVNIEYLRELSELVGDSWESLAEKLDISRKRCSVIKKSSDSAETQAYEMLITWVKKLPVSKNKVVILCRALNSSGHPHLAASLRNSERERRLRRENDNSDYDQAEFNEQEI